MVLRRYDSFGNNYNRWQEKCHERGLMSHDSDGLEGGQHLINHSPPGSKFHNQLKKFLIPCLI